MSARAQKDKISRLNLSDKKMARLFSCKKLSENDQYFINYVYEEKQNLGFFYGIGFSFFSAISINYFCFKGAGYPLQIVFGGSVFLGMHILFKRSLETRFTNLIGPYFEKYEIR